MTIKNIVASVLVLLPCLSFQALAAPLTTKQTSGKHAIAAAHSHRSVNKRQATKQQGHGVQGQGETTWVVQARPAVIETRADHTEGHIWGYGLGPYVTRNLDTESLVYAFSATNYREVSPHAEVRYRLGFGAADDGSTQMMSFTLGGAYFVLPTTITPVLGAEFGLGYARSKTLRNTAGFAGATSVGLRLFRSAAAQIEINARYESIFNGNERGLPAGYGLQFALLL